MRRTVRFCPLLQSDSLALGSVALAQQMAGAVVQTLATLFVGEAYLLEWATCGFVLGINYGVSARVITQQQAPQEQLVGGVLVRDASLLHTGDSTVSGTALFALAFGPPAGVVLLSALLRGGRLSRSALALGTRETHHFMLSLLTAYSLASCWKIWLNVGVGRLRPDWYQRVAGGDVANLLEGRHSYPSGHAAYSHASAAVTACHLAARLAVFATPQPRLLYARLLLAASPLAVAAYVAASRLTDHVHHYSDVNAGTFIGLACGVASYHLHFSGAGMARRREALWPGWWPAAAREPDKPVAEAEEQAALPVSTRAP